MSTVTAAGGDVSTGIPGGSMAVSAPPGAFPTPVQIEVTTPTLSDVATALPTLGYSAYSAVAGVGIKVLDGNGAAVTGNFAKPLTVTLTGPSLGVAGEKVLEIDGSSKVITLSSATSAGAVTFQIPADPDIVVVNPTVATTSVSHNGSPAGATSVHTGKPFAGEALLAALLIVGGSAVGIRTIRQRG